MLSFFPQGVLDEILNLIGSVSEGLPSYSSIISHLSYQCYENISIKNEFSFGNIGVCKNNLVVENI